MTKRIELLDTVRGLAVVMMTVYHIFFDMAAFEYISYDEYMSFNFSKGIIPNDM